jgi:hypothetical protein
MISKKTNTETLPFPVEIYPEFVLSEKYRVINILIIKRALHIQRTPPKPKKSISIAVEPLKDSTSESGDISLPPKNPQQEPEKVTERKNEPIVIGEQYTPFQLSQFSSFNPNRITTAEV